MSVNDQNMLEVIINKYLETKDSLASETTAELEVKFGTRSISKINKNNFDNVIRYLLAKNFKFTDNGQYYLNINANDIRVQILDMINIQKYCKTNTIDESESNSNKFMEKTPFLIEEKTPARVNFDDFNFRVSYSLEKNLNSDSPEVQNIIKDWSEIKKFNRLINRYTLTNDDFPLKIDLSIVRESSNTSNIRDSNIFNSLPKYEIEFEFLNNQTSLSSINNLVKKVGKYILSGLQDTNYPIPYTQISLVSQSYLKLINSQKSGISPNEFIGPSSITLQISNIAPSNDSNFTSIRKDYTVTDKADGDRKLLYVDEIGKIYLINTQMNIQFTGAETKNKDLFNTLFDGEHIKHNKLGSFINLYAAFDIYFINGKDVRSLSFTGSSESADNYRWNILDTSIKKLQAVLVNTTKLSPIRVDIKKFYDVNEKQSVFMACNLINKQILENQYEYETDGFIFTPKNYGVGLTSTDKKVKSYKHTWELSFKWKPAEFNTIDFLLSTKKTATGTDFIGNKFEQGLNTSVLDQIVQYKTVVLRVGYDVKKHGYANPCQNILEDKIPEKDDLESTDRYKPVQFVPSNPYDPNAGIANIELKLDNLNEKQMFTEDNSVIEDNTIVECRYDMERPSGWRWVPIRIRYDKTAEFRAGFKNYGNAYHVAQNNWYSIHNPISIEMITTGNNIPNEISQDDIYYNQVRGPKVMKGLRDFHNLVVKSDLINYVSNPGDILIDYAVGKGGDMPKWIHAKLEFVFGIDFSKDNIRNSIDGVCARYLNYKQKFEQVPDGLFVYGDSSKNIKNTNAIFSDTGKLITDAVFGKGKKDELPKGLQKSFAIANSGFNISSIQFAIHYMFGSNESLNEFLTNLSECTKVGGYLIGTCFNGKKIFDLLSNTKINENFRFINRNKETLLQITKQYDRDEFTDDISSLGYAIDVYQSSINKTFTEYLVNFDYLTSVLENYGFVPLSLEELNKINLTQSIGSFEYLYNNMQNAIKKGKLDKNSIGESYKMTREEKDISFLNNYFIYKKVRNVNIEDIKNVVTANTDEEELEKLKESLQTKNDSVSIEPIPIESLQPDKEEEIAPIKIKTKTKTKK